MARQRFRGGPRVKPGTDWGRHTSTSPISVAANTKVVLATLVLANPGISETVRRTRGRFIVTSDQATIWEMQLGALGMIVVNDSAITVGATAIPGPVTDENDDGWFLWEPIMTGCQVTEGASAGAVAGGAPMYACTFEFDSKAMRKIEQGFGVAVMVENGSGSVAFEVAIGFSILSSRR